MMKRKGCKKERGKARPNKADTIAKDSACTPQSPLDVEGIDLQLTKEEIVAFIHEGRKYS
ncbi:MAG: hypothetical protein KDE56_10925 [Anaerolineales bacterium]|nr:hypothetical protein [Anaerolineales bacterium]